MEHNTSRPAPVFVTLPQPRTTVTTLHHGHNPAPRSQPRTTVTTPHHGHNPAPRSQPRTKVTTLHHGHNPAPRSQPCTTVTTLHYASTDNLSSPLDCDSRWPRGRRPLYYLHGCSVGGLEPVPQALGSERCGLSCLALPCLMETCGKEVVRGGRRSLGKALWPTTAYGRNTSVDRWINLLLLDKVNRVNSFAQVYRYRAEQLFF
ncbi:hypothetical protein RRG08_040194 [Elysia crispata]|uniref:Uncharacterized protein n=1 Tax=Elysia crispata TaxID=231223 RepID=A0AAE0XX48_9GAST|nr:hypothetical protein RRG08_040194 [Elysia crispata]